MAAGSIVINKNDGTATPQRVRAAAAVPAGGVRVRGRTIQRATAAPCDQARHAADASHSAFGAAATVEIGD